MERSVIVRGRLADRQHIELDEPMSDIDGEVEVVVRALPRAKATSEESIFDFIARLPPGTRTKADIDRQIEEERDRWEDR